MKNFTFKILFLFLFSFLTNCNVVTRDDKKHPSEFMSIDSTIKLVENSPEQYYGKIMKIRGFPKDIVYQNQIVMFLTSNESPKVICHFKDDNFHNIVNRRNEIFLEGEFGGISNNGSQIVFINCQIK